jgi:hypothetical protein
MNLISFGKIGTGTKAKQRLTRSLTIGSRPGYPEPSLSSRTGTQT